MHFDASCTVEMEATSGLIVDRKFDLMTQSLHKHRNFRYLTKAHTIIIINPFFDVSAKVGRETENLISKAGEKDEQDKASKRMDVVHLE